MTGTAVVSKVSEPGMKDSGVEWIGKMPENWNICRVKDVVKIENGKDYKEIYDENGPIPVMGSGGCFTHCTEELYSGPSVLLGRKGTINHPLYVDYPFWCVDTMFYTRIKQNINPKFFFYCALCFPFDFYQYGSALPSMTQSDLYTISIPYPELTIQKKIVANLDKKCNAIDSLISAQKNLVTKLKEYRQSLITEAVTKGLDPDAPMKDSGVGWIMKIPESWESARLKTLFGFRKGLSITKANLVEDGVRVISYGQVHAKYNRSTGIVDDLFRFVPESFLESNPECLVKKGDFIFTDTSEDLEGLCDFVHVDRDEQIFAGYHSIIFDNKNEQNGRYLAYLFMTDCWRNQFRCNAMAVKVFSLTQSVLKQATVILPPKEVQDRIAVFLDKKCNAINSLILKINQNISKLSEIKQSLIYEYVTGKKQVPAEALE